MMGRSARRRSCWRGLSCVSLPTSASSPALLATRASISSRSLRSRESRYAWRKESAPRSAVCARSMCSSTTWVCPRHSMSLRNSCRRAYESTATPASIASATGNPTRPNARTTAPRSSASLLSRVSGTCGLPALLGRSGRRVRCLGHGGGLLVVLVRRVLLLRLLFGLRRLIAHGSPTRKTTIDQRARRVGERPPGRQGRQG